MALMVSNISPAQPMKMDTFERLLAGKCKRSEENVGGGGEGGGRRGGGQGGGGLVEGFGSTKNLFVL